MSAGKRNSIVITCSIVACVVTLITCGTLIGKANSDVSHLASSQKEIADGQKLIVERVSAIETNSAFQKGVVETQLRTHGSALVRIENKLDDLVKVD